MAEARTSSSQWAFDPVVLGQRETEAWASYYRRDWKPFLRAAVGMVATGFGMGRRRSLLGAWLVLRANQAWSPYPDNDPDSAREYMRRFYALVAGSGHPHLDPARASVLEVDWWRVHREHQNDPRVTSDELTETLNALYAYVYDCPPHLTRQAASLRVAAMDLSDRWVEEGCELDHPLLVEVRKTLVASFTALRDATERAALR